MSILSRLLVATLLLAATTFSQFVVTPLRAGSSDELVPNTERLGVRESSLIMPLFLDFPGGEVSLFAVRNASDSPINLGVAYVLADGTAITDDTTLGAQDTLTVNIRDVPLPDDPDIGAPIGYVIFDVLDNQGGFLDNPVLVGDWYFVDLANDFAFGASLPSFSDLCGSISTRYGTGGVFNGTEFFILTPDNLSGNNTALADVDIYDEQGVSFGSFIYSSDKTVSTITTDAIMNAGIDIPAFGSFVWNFRNGDRGFVSGSTSADGRFSIGLEGSCLD